MPFLQSCARVVVISGLVAVAIGAGCSASTATQSEDLGSAVIAITQAPADVECIQITVEGTRTVTRDFDVQPGASTVFTLNGLPLGTATFFGEAFESACSSIAGLTPTWVSDLETAQLSSGTVASVTLTMRRNGQANVNVDFEEDCIANGDACPSATGCCSGVCDATGTCVACLAENQGCIASGACCSGLNCVGGVCTSGATCNADGAACEQNVPCCSGFCAPTGICATCALEGGACSGGSTGQCCTGLTCTNGVCVAPPTCNPNGAACSPNLPCCSDFCTPTGICATCALAGGACSGGSTGQCCTGLTCTNGVCVAPPTCIATGSACQQSVPCCSGVCNPTGVCG